MFYSSTKYDSIMDWVFSFGGIITIALIILAIWLIYNYFKNRNKDNNNNNGQMPNYYPQNKKTIYDSQYDNEFGSESFWDDMPKADMQKTNSEQGTNIYPTREEEPIPPNAIPPSSYVEEESFEKMKVEDDVKIYEKEVTKKVIEDDIYFDEKVPVDEKENE